MIPFYLQAKLAKLAILNIVELRQLDYLKVYRWLKLLYPSLGNNVLYDLHCLSNGLALNSLNKEQQHFVFSQYKQQLPSYPPLAKNIIDGFLHQTLELSRYAITSNEIPIACIIVKNGVVIGRGYNQTRAHKQITGHAEILAIHEAASSLGTHRLTECDLYVTIEPCLMCVGAIMHSRIQRVIFGALEPKTGAIISQYRALDNFIVNKHTEAIGPIDNELYAEPLQEFLRAKRIK